MVIIVIREALMNIQLPVHNMDKAAFLAWVQTQEGRYELAQGRVIMMPGASKDHAIIVMNLASLIRTQLDRRKWTVVAEFGLDAGPETLRYPDVMVDRAGNGRALTATAPALLAEVLSPSTESLDLRDKAAEYLQLPSLFAYLVSAQTQAKVWAWSRRADRLPSDPEVTIGIKETVHVSSLNLMLPLTDVYADTEVALVR